MRGRTFSRRVCAGALSATTCALLLGACTTSDADPTPSTSSSETSVSPSPTSTPPEDPAIAAAEAAVLEAYRGYWAAKVVSYADPTVDQDPNLVYFSDDTALTDAQSTIITLRSNGIAIPGAPELVPVVSDIVLGDAGSAKILDCVDSTNWQPIYAATGESATAPDQSLRVVTESTAFVAEGRWRVRTSTPFRDTTC